MSASLVGSEMCIRDSYAGLGSLSEASHVPHYAATCGLPLLMAQGGRPSARFVGTDAVGCLTTRRSTCGERAFGASTRSSN
eukprot:4942628-Alexandrium_andersonii.AAC.1